MKINCRYDSKHHYLFIVILTIESILVSLASLYANPIDLEFNRRIYKCSIFY